MYVQAVNIGTIRLAIGVGGDKRAVVFEGELISERGNLDKNLNGDYEALYIADGFEDTLIAFSRKSNGDSYLREITPSEESGLFAGKNVEGLREIAISEALLDIK